MQIYAFQLNNLFASKLPFFNEDAYLEFNPDIKAAVEQGLLNARMHFDLWGKAEGRMAGYLFNPIEYLAMNPDLAYGVAQGWINAYEHFENHGMYENRAPFAGFDPDYYLAANPDVAAAVLSGLTTAVQHFMEHGYQEVRNFNPDFNIHDYLAGNPDAQAAIESGAISPAELFVQHLLEVASQGSATDGQDTDSPITDGVGDIDFSDWEGADIDSDELEAIWQQMMASMSDQLDGLNLDLERLQKVILESGLLDPANLNPDGSGLIDPQPLIDLIFQELYGTSNPLDLVGGGAAGITLPDGLIFG